MRTSLVKACLFAALASGCTGSGQVTYSAGVSPPQLVEISPGVQVIVDYDEPVFYSDDFYWRYDAGVWYRSRYHTRGWTRVQAPPPRIRQIDRPTAYIHYRGGAQAGPVVRDHRDYQPPPPPPPAPAPVVREHRDYQPPPPPAPVVRDHRADQPPPPPPAAPPPVDRDHRAPDEKAERREQKEERRDDRKDRKDERKDDKKDKGDHRR